MHLRSLILAVAALAVAALSGCVTPLAEDATGSAMTYRCEGGARFTAAYAVSGREATVTAGANTYRLKNLRSGSDARYAGGGVTLSSKGTQAQLTGAAGGPYRDCRTG